MTAYSLTENGLYGSGEGAVDEHITSNVMPQSSFRHIHEIQASQRRLQYEYDREIACVIHGLRDGAFHISEQGAECLPKKRTWLRWQRYYRFCLQYPAMTIDQRTFYAYWRQFVDPEVIHNQKPSEDSPYLQEVFHAIAEHHAVGIPPQKQTRRIKSVRERQRGKGKLSEHQKEGVGVLKAILAELTPHLDTIVGFLGQPRSGYAPDKLSAYADAILRGKKRIEALKFDS